jgi:hypothetical protein
VGITREIFRAHQTTVATELFCDIDKVAVVLDCTYVYIQKGSNNVFQRASYSGHKHRSLLKPFMVVSPDGHIIDALGLFEANVNGATIARNIGPQLRIILEEGDVCVVNRGFRDAVSHLTALGLDVRMPESNSSHQLTVDQANRTRLVTKCRSIVEVINGHLKQCFRYFDKVWPNQSIPHMMVDFRIACTILNAYHPGIESDVGDGLEIAETMLARVGERNGLGDMVVTMGLNRKSSS